MIPLNIRKKSKRRAGYQPVDNHDLAAFDFQPFIAQPKNMKKGRPPKVDKPPFSFDENEEMAADIKGYPKLPLASTKKKMDKPVKKPLNVIDKSKLLEQKEKYDQLYDAASEHSEALVDIDKPTKSAPIKMTALDRPKSGIQRKYVHKRLSEDRRKHKAIVDEGKKRNNMTTRSSDTHRVPEQAPMEEDGVDLEIEIDPEPEAPPNLQPSSVQSLPIGSPVSIPKPAASASKQSPPKKYDVIIIIICYLLFIVI